MRKGTARQVVQAWRRLAWLPLLASLVGCGGRASNTTGMGTEPADATSSPGDAGADVRTNTPDLDGSAADSDGPALACSTCGDATDAGAPDDGAAVADAMGDNDADARATFDDICHVVWPQAWDESVQSIQMAVDSTGNAYIAVGFAPTVGYASPAPALDLGVTPSPSYPFGVALAKVDSACNLLWMREIGTSISGATLGNRAIAVDAQSNVTLLGAFSGSVDFAGTTLDNGDAGVFPGYPSPYLIRFDGSGQVVFTKVLRPTVGYSELNASSLAVSPDGTATIAVWEASPASTPDAGIGTAAQYYVQFDGTGAMAFQSSASTAGPWVGPWDDLFPDPTGGLWALGGPGNGVTSPYSTSMVFHLTSSGSVSWAQSFTPSGNDLFASGADAGYLLGVVGGPPATESLQAYLPDGASPWTQVTHPLYEGALFAQQMVIDANGHAIVGGEFRGAIEMSADGSVVTAPDGAVAVDPTPMGIGFRAFDGTGHLLSVKTWHEAVADGGNEVPPGGGVFQFGAIAVDPQGHVLLAGLYGPDKLTNLFLAKLAP